MVEYAGRNERCAWSVVGKFSRVKVELAYHHLIDGFYNFTHFISRDESIVIYVVETEGPCKIISLKLIYLYCTSTRQ